MYVGMSGKLSLFIRHYYIKKCFLLISTLGLFKSSVRVMDCLYPLFMSMYYSVLINTDTRTGRCGRLSVGPKMCLLYNGT